MWSYYNTLLNQVHGFSVQDWLTVFAVAVALGMFALRGFGSRSTY